MTVRGDVVGEIRAGVVVLLGVASGDTAAEAERLAGKVAKLRIFETRTAASTARSSRSRARRSS